MAKMLILQEVADKLRISKSTFYEMLKSGEFPDGIRVTRGRRVWSEDQVDQWLRELTEAQTA